MTAHAEAKMGQLPPEPEKATLEGKNKILGFWLFLGAETVLFASLFGTYLGLKSRIPEGHPMPQELFSLPMVFVMTMVLLTSSLTSVLAVVAMHRNNFRMMQTWFVITVLLGLAFLGLEIYEFVHYAHEGHTFTKNAFASAFYTLVGFHGGHVLFGVLWISALILQAFKKGLTLITAPKIYVASLYWHFIDVVWVFIFTLVYLVGKVG